MVEEPFADKKKTLPSLLAGVLLRPRTIFTHLHEHQPRSWWAPALLILLCSLLPLLVSNAVANRATDSMTGNMAVMPTEPAVKSRGGGIIGEPAPEMSRQPTALDILKITGALISLPLTWLLWAGALYLASVFLGRSSGFAAMFRLTVWTWLPYAVRGLLQAIYIWITGQIIVNKGFAGFVMDNNLPQFVTPGPGKLALAGILGRFDIFLIWNLALLVVGLMAFTKLPRRKAIVAILVIWGVLSLLGVIPAILGGMFSSITM